MSLLLPFAAFGHFVRFPRALITYSRFGILAPNLPAFSMGGLGLNCRALFAGDQFEKEVTTMIRKLQRFLSTSRGKRSRRQFNRPLLEKQREDVFLLIHQQLGGMR
jgi:hypothetical protein